MTAFMSMKQKGAGAWENKISDRKTFLHSCILGE